MNGVNFSSGPFRAPKLSKGGILRQVERHLPLISVFAIALAVRLYVYLHTAVINPDGPLYIYQARSLFGPAGGSLTGCGIGYLSVYPYLIYLFQHLVGDWVTASRLVSLFFGTVLLLPAYLLLREFFDRPVSLCTLLAFALVPTMVGRSVDVVRDPVAWFFLVSGVLLVVVAVRRRHPVYLFPALAVFGLAAWARIDSLMFILATALALSMMADRRRLNCLAWFFGPMLLAVIVLLGVKFSGGGLGNHYRFDEILQRADLLDRYHRLLHEVKSMLPGSRPDSPAHFFLLEARRFAWLIAAAGVVNRMFEAFSYGFAMLFLIGLFRYRRRFADEILRLYFPLLCIFSFLLLYAFMLESWIMEYRYTVLIMIGGLVILGCGVEWLLECLHHCFKISGTILTVLVGALLFLSVAPKLFQERATTEVVFREAGEMAAQKKGGGPVRVMASREHIRLVSFFANRGTATPQCPQPEADTYENAATGSLAAFLSYLRQERIGFFLWEENNWAGRIPLEALLKSGHFQELGRWVNPQTGQMILYKCMDLTTG